MVFFESYDGTRLHGRWAGCGKNVIVYCPGTGSSTVKAEPFLEPLEDLGLSTFAYDHRGTGMSKGTLMDFGKVIGEDIKAVIDFVENRMEKKQINDGRIYVAGHSLGAAIAIQALRDDRVSGVFAMSVLYTVDDLDQEMELFSTEMFKEIVTGKFFFKKFLKIATFQKQKYMAKNIALPEDKDKLFLIHGGKDSWMPWERTGALLSEHVGLTDDHILIIDDAGHSYDDYYEEIAAWILKRI